MKTDPTHRFPKDDEQPQDPYVDAGNNVDIVQEVDDCIPIGEKREINIIEKQEFGLEIKESFFSVSKTEHEDNIWQQLEKQEQKINDYWERNNESKFEERKQGE